jgi:hypothetical protein
MRRSTTSARSSATSSSAFTTSARTRRGRRLQRPIDASRSATSARPNGDLFGARRRFSSRRSAVRRSASAASSAARRPALDALLPAVGPLQPQDADRIDELGHGAGGDRRAEHVVGVDRPAQGPERLGGNPCLARRPHLDAAPGSSLAFVDLVDHHDGELDGTAQMAVLDRCRTDMTPTYSRTERRS